MRYQVEFDGKVIEDSLFYVGDKRMSSLRRSSTFKDSTPTASFYLPRGILISEQADSLGVRFRTPCGPSKPVSLTLLSPASRKTETELLEKRPSWIDVRVKVAPHAGWPEPVRFWVDSRPDLKDKYEFRVGQARVWREWQGLPLFGLGCAREHRVTLNSKPVGKISGSADTRFFLIAPKSDACYVEADATWKSGTPKKLPRVLVGKHVYALRTPVDHFVERIPKSASDDTRNVLLRVSSVADSKVREKLREWCQAGRTPFEEGAADARSRGTKVAE